MVFVGFSKKCDLERCASNTEYTVELRGVSYFLCGEHSNQLGLVSAAENSDAILNAIRVLRNVSECLDPIVVRALETDEAIRMLEFYHDKTK